ncbi:hypothetical protein B0H66DRAFT_529983 [Apodospora peruviana]|uniref:Uncharacterized protein n=1 Tax=Apodospora peruviana TaxID=516989 RepID=A0AAE0IIY3_9PEZI|nr:hypothetical protein B0H66DRAFT_529983 [Apodospora peruviana]
MSNYDISTVPNVEDKGYIVEKVGKDGADDVLIISSDAVYVAKLPTNKDEGSVTMDDARLKRDENHPGNPKGKGSRARLWEMQATVAFHKSGMKPGDVELLRAEQVEETRSTALADWSREQIGVELDFAVRKDSTGIERQVFDANLKYSGLGQNAQAFLAKVGIAEKEVKEICVGPGAADNDFNYTFFVG